ncbi:MAG: FAD-binding protein [Dysosmobacter sp.]
MRAQHRRAGGGGEPAGLRGFAPAGQAALVLGAGGAAKAAALALAQAGCRVTVCARTPERSDGAEAARCGGGDCLALGGPARAAAQSMVAAQRHTAARMERVRRSSSLWISYRRAGKRQWYTIWCTIPRTQL